MNLPLAPLESECRVKGQTEVQNFNFDFLLFWKCPSELKGTYSDSTHTKTPVLSPLRAILVEFERNCDFVIDDVISLEEHV